MATETPAEPIYLARPLWQDITAQVVAGVIAGLLVILMARWLLRGGPRGPAVA